MSRPFGVAMLFAGVDQEGPKLFHLDPSGTFIDCLAKAIGAASDGAEQNLKEQYHEVSALKSRLWGERELNNKYESINFRLSR